MSSTTSASMKKRRWSNPTAPQPPASEVPLRAPGAFPFHPRICCLRFTDEEKAERRRAYMRELMRRKYANPEERARRKERMKARRDTDPDYAARERLRMAERRKDPEYVSRERKRLFNRRAGGVFPEHVFVLALSLQNNRCAICQIDLGALPRRQVHRDHCHTTNTPRGVLCHWCNVAVGSFKDDPARLLKAVEYLANPPLHGASVGN
jgi:hypothetical protein